MVKYTISMVFDGGEVLGRTAFREDVIRTDGNETMAAGHAVIHDGLRALSVISGGTYGLSCKNGKLSFLLLRTAAYCAYPIENRPLVPNDRYTPHIDIGERMFDLEINASELEERLENIEMKTALFSQTPHAMRDK